MGDCEHRLAGPGASRVLGLLLLGGPQGELAGRLWGDEHSGRASARSTVQAAGISEGRPCCSSGRPPGHTGAWSARCGCPASWGLSARPVSDQPFSDPDCQVWMRCLSGVNPPSLPGKAHVLCQPQTDAHRCHLLGLRCGGGRVRGLVPHPRLLRALSRLVWRAQQCSCICSLQRPGTGGEAPPHGNRVPEGLTGPSSEDLTQGHSLQPLQGSMDLPTPVPTCTHTLLLNHSPGPRPLAGARPLCPPPKAVADRVVSPCPEPLLP